MPDQETFKMIVAASTPFITAIVDAWIKPKIQALVSQSKRDNQLIAHSLDSKFGEYLCRAYEKHSYFHSLVFNNQRKLLNDFYIPLTVRLKNGDSVSLTSFPKDLIPKHKKVLLVDNAGMGKSTALKFLFLSCIRQNEGIPIFIELRHLSPSFSVIDYVEKEVNAINEGFDRHFILDLIKRGDFIFFLDGLDEVPLDFKSKVVSELQDFISKAGNNLFILSSRRDESLASFADFQEFGIKPLSTKEAFDLIRKYDPDGKVSEDLIAKLEGKTLKTVSEFLSNPLLVSLLFKSFDHKPTVPLRKPIFYRQVYDALYESHDLSKTGHYIRDKASKLDLEEFHRVLRAVGFITVKLGKIEYTKDELLEQIRKAREQCVGLQFKEADFLKDLRTTVPLFVEEGQFFKWAHKAIQEYFCAQFICVDTKAEQTNLLRAMVAKQGAGRYIHILDLCYDIDYKSFRHSLIKDLLKRFILYLDSSYQTIAVEDEKREDRQRLHFAKHYVMFKGSKLGNPALPHKKIANLALEKKLAPISFECQVVMRWIGSDDACACFGTIDMLVIELLAQKGDPLIDCLIISSGSIPSEILANFEMAKIDEKPDSPWNLPESFGKTSSIMAHVGGVNLINPMQARNVLKEIDEEILRSSASQFLSLH